MDVALEGVRVDRGGRTILDVPNLLLPASRTTAILGPNGSGKTTLLRVIAGLEQPQAGRVLAGGVPIRRGAPLAFVFQEHVFLRQSVRANLELGLRLKRLAAAEIRQRIDEAARQLEITDLLDRQAHHLSGGEARRVSLARALALRPRLLLLDEPLAGLDERSFARLLHELPQLLRVFEATTLLVTHDRDEALRLAEHLVVLTAGRVRACGDKHEVAMNPRAREVAELLGYLVVIIEGRHIAIPPGAVKIGPGPLEFCLIVDDVVDLVNGIEVVGRAGDVAIRTLLADGSARPARGDRLLLHPVRFTELE